MTHPEPPSEPPSDPPPGLSSEDAEEIVARLTPATGYLLGFDFDGTLAPISPDPDVPTLSSRVESSLGGLADRDDTRVAVISGRALDDLLDRVRIPSVICIGNHGLERQEGGNRSVQGVQIKHQTAMEDVAGLLEQRVGDVPGCHVEQKGPTLSVHVRQTPEDQVPAVRQMVDVAVTEANTESDIESTGSSTEDTVLRMIEGKQVFEVRPAIQHDKGTAIHSLAVDLPSGWQQLYVGDDVTDEDAFEALRPEGISIAVGPGDSTAAEFRIADQEYVPDFLRWLQAVIGPSSDKQ